MAGIMEKLKKFLSVGDDYEDYSDEEYAAESGGNPTTQKTAVHESVKARGNLVALPSTKSLPKQEIIVVSIVGSNQTKGIADYLTQDKCVVVNVSAADKGLSRRTLDFLSGISFARGGSKAKIADNIYIFAPASMTISAAQSDLSDEENEPPASNLEGRNEYLYRS